mmetsp:Transcript_62875/g.70413  ORF Transcript_62875/g.70413 Transcript_62875/m.70413 type:complete len:345 (+) Transcript_62875:96-1130(+)|eukprot:CAMPEP_0170993000 /NCGR_PEP_ID=MMETSP0736-20130129/10075_1 /TAXON_ID=186038 /ORGANISM="Fragilariopsis kerguelensis, Strain L26-C5" /LENGTH=344 /DNA_ID=CAMNT_0011418559 /DNA_START=331 /DNA_END=1365 /DNA_ORIENTATION=+
MSVASFTETGMYPQEFLAKKLNNRASFLLSTGNYEDSISLLRTALSLAEWSSNLSENKQPCSCQSCSLETSLSTDHDDSFVTMMMSDHEQEGQHNIIEKKQQKKESSDDDTVMIHYDDHHTENETEDDTLPPLHRQTTSATTQQQCHDASSSTQENGLVYSRPLLVNKRCLEDRHFMGMILSLMILFNLALAHHLLALTGVAQNDKTGTNSPLQQALRIYKFAYGLYQDYKDQPFSSPQPMSCPDHHHNNNSNNNDDEEGKTEYSNQAAGNIKLTMIVSNNIGEIHRMVGDPLKHQRSLQQLLSLMMFVVDDCCNLVVLDASEMDGFYHNLIPFILDAVCAQAA